jgi:hypothetical protein
VSEDGTGGRAPTGWLGHLRAGLTEPSSTALAVAFVIALGGMGALMGFARPDRLIGMHAYLARDARDERPFVTAEVLRAVMTPNDAGNVAILGASGIREAVSRRDAAELLLTAAGPTGLLHLTAGGLNTWEMVAVVDALWPVLDGVLVLGVGPTLFSLDPSEVVDLVKTPRFGFPAPVMDAEAVRLGYETPLRTGNYLWDQRTYYLSRMTIGRSRLLRGPARLDPHRFDALPAGDDDAWDMMEVRFPERIASYERNVEYHVELLGRMIRRVQQRGGVRILLTEAPLNPHALEIPLVRQWYETHVARMNELSREWGVPYERLDEEARLAAADFHDITHLSRQGARERFTRALVDRIARELEDRP